MVSTKAGGRISSAFSVGWTVHRIRMAPGMGSFIRHGNPVAWVDPHACAGDAHDQFAALPFTGTADRSGSLGSSRRPDPPWAGRSHASIDGRECTFTHCFSDSLSDWLWLIVRALSPVQPRDRWHAHAKYVLC